MDEALKAENDFINEPNDQHVHHRLRSLAEAHVDRCALRGAGFCCLHTLPERWYWHSERAVGAMGDVLGPYHQQ